MHYKLFSSRNASDVKGSSFRAKLSAGVLWSLNVKYVSKSVVWVVSNDLFAAFIKRRLLSSVVKENAACSTGWPHEGEC
jgi:hypothetical protein